MAAVRNQRSRSPADGLGSFSGSASHPHVFALRRISPRSLIGARKSAGDRKAREEDGDRAARTRYYVCIALPPAFLRLFTYGHDAPGVRKRRRKRR
ncbi:Hypothetical protein NTJ_04175 [Nesidiocoris tenuis]|uniref:Uncharacterized protein n=1 Tax=Nesidiocoris tenuis TaxID=355587 RepID=A0ABN7AJC4_9HEMI|nr:Hypothetical protein NTJ_04175 [Nesidiocoris tenuis]